MIKQETAVPKKAQAKIDPKFLKKCLCIEEKKSLNKFKKKKLKTQCVITLAFIAAFQRNPSFTAMQLLSNEILVLCIQIGHTDVRLSFKTKNMHHMGNLWHLLMKQQSGPFHYPEPEHPLWSSVLDLLLNIMYCILDL